MALDVRDTAKGERAAARIAGADSRSLTEFDLSDLDQVTGCARTLLDLSFLIRNTGVMGEPVVLT